MQLETENKKPMNSKETLTITKFRNTRFQSGDKNGSNRIRSEVLRRLGMKYKKDGKKMIEIVLRSLVPLGETKSAKRSGRVYQVPTCVNKSRGRHRAIQFLLDAANKRVNLEKKTMTRALARSIEISIVFENRLKRIPWRNQTTYELVPRKGGETRLHGKRKPKKKIWKSWRVEKKREKKKTSLPNSEPNEPITLSEGFFLDKTSVMVTNLIPTPKKSDKVIVINRIPIAKKSDKARKENRKMSTRILVNGKDKKGNWEHTEKKKLVKSIDESKKMTKRKSPTSVDGQYWIRKNFDEKKSDILQTREKRHRRVYLNRMYIKRGRWKPRRR
jgi:ribosomal protein S7